VCYILFLALRTLSIEHVCRRSVCVFVQIVYCGKMANWIWLPFGMVSGVGRGMGVLDGGGERRRGRDSFGVNLVCPIVINGDLLHSCARATSSSEMTLGGGNNDNIALFLYILVVFAVVIMSVWLFFLLCLQCFE